jgi:hypothetical protein
VFRSSLLVSLLIVGSRCAVVADDVPIPQDWTAVEKKAWQDILVGNAATLGPSSGAPKEYGKDEQKISPEFLKTILANSAFTSQIPPKGVTIVGAWVADELNLSESEIPVSIDFQGCRFDNSVDVSHSRLAQMLQFHRSSIGRDFRGFKVQMGRRLILMDTTVGKSLAIDHAQLEGLSILRVQARDVNLIDSQVILPVTLTDLKSGSTEAPVLIRLRKSVFFDDLKFNNLVCHLSLDDADLRRDLLFANCDFTNELSATNLHVGGDLVLSGEVKGRVSFAHSKVDRDLRLADAYFMGDMDLAGATISRSIILSCTTEDVHNCKWVKGLALTLTDTSVYYLRDSTIAWPDNLHLDGFSYKKWRAAKEGDRREEFTTRDVQQWFIPWLRKEKIYSPEPYRQLAAAFRDAGLEDKAMQILFKGKQRERHILRPFSKFLSTLSLIFIGYGYHYEYSVYWCAGFVLCGVLVLTFTREGRDCRRQNPDFGYSDLFFFSLDAFLPFVRLRNRFGDIDFKSWIRFYFYVHRLAGYVIGSFILAGLAGITK